MTQGIQIVPANVMSNTISNHINTINQYGDNVETFHMKIPTNQTVYPMNASNNQITFNIPCGGFAIDVQGSYINMNMLMTYHFANCPFTSAINGTATTATFKRAWMTNCQWFQQDYLQTSQNGSGTATSLVPVGRPYRVALGTTDIVKMFFQSTASLGSLSNTSQRLWEKMWKYVVKQSADTCDSDSSTFFMAGDNSYEKAAIQFDGIPYVMTGTTRTPVLTGVAGATTWSASLKQQYIAPEFSVNLANNMNDYYVSKNVTFRVPICYLNDVFMTTKNPLIYINSVRNQNMQLDLQFREFTFSKLFGWDVSAVALGTANTEQGLCDRIILSNAADGAFFSPFLSGVSNGAIGGDGKANNYTISAIATCCTQIQLWLACKKSQLFDSDINSMDIVMEIIEACTHQSMNAPIQGTYSFQQPKQVRNVSELMYITVPNDQNEKNSLYALGLASKLKAIDIINILNGDMTYTANASYPNAPGPLTQAVLPDFYDVNLTLSNSNYDYVRGIGGFENQTQLKNISLQALHLLGNPFTGACPIFTDLLWKLVANIIIIDCDKFKGKLFSGEDMIDDGLNTMSSSINFRYNYIAAWDPSQQAGNGSVAPKVFPTAPGQDTQLPYMYKGFPALTFTCYYYNEQYLIFKPMENGVLLTDNIRPYSTLV